MDQRSADDQLDPSGRHVEQDLEEAEAYLGTEVLVHENAWPEHYREALGRLGMVMHKMLDADQREEVEDAIVQLLGAVDSVQLRVGFALGRSWAAFGELTVADCCRAVEAAGGNPGRALAETVDSYLAGVIQ